MHGHREQWQIQRGANPAMAPHQNWQWSLAPLRDRKSNGSIVILSKSKDFGPPVAMLATDLAPPYGKIAYKTRKRSSEILGDRCGIFLGMEKFFREIPKKGRSKISSKIWPPPVCEGLHPLVYGSHSHFVF